MPSFSEWFASMWFRKNDDDDLERELRSHIELEASEQQAAGAPRDEALYAARRAFGNATRIKEDIRQRRRWTFLEHLLQDVRYAARLLRKSPGFSAVAMVTLALGIGANTAIFSIADQVLLRPLPFRDPNGLISIWQSAPKMNQGHLGAAPPEFVSYRDRTRAFSSVAGYQPESFDITGGQQPEHVLAYAATASLFTTLEVKPLLGRAFTKQDEAPRAARVVALSYSFWKRRYAENPEVIGTMIRLNEQPYQIVGVVPRGFTFPATAATPGEPPALWTPLIFQPGELNDWASSFDTSIIARLRPGVTRALAQDDVRRVATGFQREHRDIYSGNVALEGNAEPWAPDFGPGTRTVVRMLCAAVGIVLLIACVNVANLLLARSGARRREMAVRRALGASPNRLTRQILTETALLTGGGGVLGCVLAYALLRVVDGAALQQINTRAATLDLRMYAFTFALCATTALVCGMAPAWMFRRSTTHDALKESAKLPGSSRGNRSLSRILIAAEIACCVLLLMGSGLLFRSFMHTIDVPLGFDPGHTLIVRTTLNSHRYASPDGRHAAERAIEARLASLPGVSAAALTTHVPLADERQIGFVIDGAPRDQFHWADNALVSAGYFAAMKTPLLKGRTFSDADTPHSPLTAIVNESMARQFWPRVDPIGRGFAWGGRPMTVVGVVADIHVQALDKPVGPMIYSSVYQMESGASASAVFVIRCEGLQGPARLAASAQSVIWSVDKGLPILGVTTLQQVVSASLAIRRLSLALVASFALLALLLSLVGIYGVQSYAVTQRTQEIGVRLALGAKPTDIAALVIREGTQLALIGIVLGLICGAALTRYIEQLLFGVRAIDPLSFAGGASLVFAASLLASYLPARRASRVPPMIALRCD